jgi:nitroimidazol reductase NimA-like FMN-containing flavoprotein (pyridoxamine 5'-phosphate oxidase superfamily)
MSDRFASSARTQVKRRPQRASYDRATVYAILDEALIGSLAVVMDGEPFVQPMIHARDGDELILHGSSANRMLGAIENGARCCLSVSLIDGLVLGRSIPDHTFQYRSVSIHGVARLVADPVEKRARMRTVFDHIIRDRWDSLPPVSDDYLTTVKVLTMPLEECVAKINTDVPKDTPGDPPNAVWSGVLPFALLAGTLQAAPGPQPQPNAVLENYRRSHATYRA